MPDIVSGPSLASARTGPGTLAGPDGTRRNRTRQGGGSERALLTATAPCGKAAPAATPRSPARPRRPSRGLAAHRTCLVHCHAQAWVMGGPGCPDATMPVPGLCRPGRRRPSPVRSSCPPGVLRGEPQRSSTPHPLAPCGGDASATLSDGPAGSEARMRPHRPHLHRRSFRCSRSPRRPVVTARKQPCVFPHAGRCARVEPPPAPFASRHRPSGWSNIRPDRSRLASSALRCAGLFARRPGPKPVHGASPAGDRRPGGPCPAAPVAGRGGRPSAKPPADDLAVASPEASPPSHAGFRQTASRTGCPDGEEGKGAPVPSPAPAEGTAKLAEAREDGRGRGWSARLVLSGSGRRPGSGVSGETIAREACLRRRSQPCSHPPVGRGWWSEDRP